MHERRGHVLDIPTTSTLVIHGPRPGADAATWAVTAHSLLNSITTIVGYSDLLQRGSNPLPEDQRTEVLAAISRQARLASDVLTDLVRGSSGGW